MEVVDKGQVVGQLPPRRIRRHALLEQPDGQVCASRPVGRLKRKKHGAETIRDQEMRIECRGEIEQRIDEFKAPAPIAVLQIAPVMLNGPDPVDVGSQRVK